MYLSISTLKAGRVALYFLAFIFLALNTLAGEDTDATTTAAPVAVPPNSTGTTATAAGQQVVYNCNDAINLLFLDIFP